jgi:hypothetical protein
MYNGLLHLHNLMRWVVLIFALITIIRSLSGLSGRKPFAAGDKRAGMLYMISIDIQALIGILLYITQKWYNVLMSGGAMKNPAARFFSMEHFLGMLIALILVHIGYSATKKNIPDGTKFKRLFWYSLLSLIIILAMIPWPFREFIGRPWFPGR